MPPEVITIDAEVSASGGDCFVKASARSSNGVVSSLCCELFDQSDSSIYREALDGASGYWELVNRSGSCTVRVTATSQSGATEVFEQPVTLSVGDCIWPIEPEYAILEHDRYLVSSGKTTISGYTHNNGLMRQKHYVYGQRRNHYGLDITASPGSAVKAVSQGKVTGVHIDTDAIGSTGYGLYLVVEHTRASDGGRFYALYAHLSETAVRAGDAVEQGQIIASSGNSGGSRIPHLHLELRLDVNDRAYTVDPLELLPSRDFSIREQAIAKNGGFSDSSIALYSSIYDDGWDYKIYGKLRNDASTPSGTLSSGTSVEIINRSDDIVTCSYGDGFFTQAASQLDYTFDY